MQRPIKCSLCASPKAAEVYNGVVRSGGWGSFTRRKYKIFNCSNCGISFISPIPNIDYAKGRYRNAYNGSSEVETYFRLHDKEQINYLGLISDLILRDKTVCDIGCGGGSFLDHVKGLARRTIGIEPFAGYRRSLNERGHIVFSSLDALMASKGTSKPDLVTSFHVIEHVDEPIAFLRKIRNVLKPDGRAVLVTPNADDILMKLNLASYRKFHYRTAHLWYFNDRSLQYAAMRAGFSKIKIQYRHSYDLSNFALWLRDGRPTGNGAAGVFAPTIDRAWRAWLEESRMADTIVIYLIK